MCLAASDVRSGTVRRHGQHRHFDAVNCGCFRESAEHNRSMEDRDESETGWRHPHQDRHHATLIRQRSELGSGLSSTTLLLAATLSAVPAHAVKTTTADVEEVAHDVDVTMENDAAILVVTRELVNRTRTDQLAVLPIDLQHS